MFQLVIGRRRMGKSTLSVQLAYVSHRLLNRNDNATIIIFDPNSQYRNFPFITSSIQAVRNWLDDSEVNPGFRVCVFRPQVGMIEADFEALTNVLWDYDEYCFIADEASTIQNSHWIHPNLERLIRQAPAGVAVIQTTHRMVDVHRLCRSQSTDVFLFRTTNTGDLKVIESEFSPRIAELVKSLGRYQCIHYWLDPSGGAEKFALWDDSEEWFVELGNGNEIRTAQDERKTA